MKKPSPNKFTVTIDLEKIFKRLLFMAIVAASVLVLMQVGQQFKVLLDNVNNNSKKIEQLLLNQQLTTNKMFDMYETVYKIEKNQEKGGKKSCDMQDLNKIIDNFIETFNQGIKE